MIKAEDVVYEYSRRDDDENVESIESGIDHVSLQI